MKMKHTSNQIVLDASALGNFKPLETVMPHSQKIRSQADASDLKPSGRMDTSEPSVVR
ncbi:hypothetical protein DPMN_192312 [Dreissena polymorpha]|uniref:Uncharacterized protein n=1 Tax=Dreissena polymorpha TaxID=45954 RepID=A0A9D3Y4J2_DREPO|nr:hypothetical protein DPMN_192312 [Dreissena polymorpha]